MCASLAPLALILIFFEGYAASVSSLAARSAWHPVLMGGYAAGARSAAAAASTSTGGSADGVRTVAAANTGGCLAAARIAM